MKLCIVYGRIDCVSAEFCMKCMSARVLLSTFYCLSVAAWPKNEMRYTMKHRNKTERRYGGASSIFL